MIKQAVLNRIAQIRYVRAAIEEKADLAAFKQKPTPRIISGLVVIGISYTIGWPVVGALSLLAAYLQKPLIVIIGGPVVYGLSHLTFILGMYLAGAEHAKVFFRWATRVTMQRLMRN